MAHHLVLGAGPTGAETAKLLAEEGETVTLVSRSGRGPRHRNITTRSLDVRTPGGLAELVRGTSTIFQCLMPPYDRWVEEFPPVHEAAIRAAVESGAALVTLSNLYPYGLCREPFVESTPFAPVSDKGRVRAKMWTDALASGARVTEVRASDFLGSGALSLFTILVLPGLRAGRPVAIPGDLDAPHPWSFVGDVARTLVAASRGDASWGRAWHVPSTSASVRELFGRFVEVGAFASAAPLTRMPREALESGDALSRAVVEMLYLFDEPLFFDSRETEAALGLRATKLDDAVRDTLV
jgi:nucleoside-diphosphate-sugar epimerase